MAKKRGNLNWRLGMLIFVFAVATMALVARLVQLQILDHQRYASEARLNHYGQETLNGRRGAILDRNGYPLAASADAYDVMVERRAWQDPQAASQAANLLSPIVGRPAQEMVARVAATDIFEVPVARGLDYQAATKVRELNLPGVRLLLSSRRVYPEGSLAAQLIGFVGRDNIGLTGLEADFEAILRGGQGALTYERDGLGNPIAVGQRREIPPQPGADIVLTIDRFIQRLAEKELDAAIKKHEAAGGTVIVIEPKTGAILAMASRPTFDLTKPDLSDESKLALFRNRATSDQYEPGSVFKLITMSAALNEGLVGPDTWWYDSGVANVGGWSIRNWNLSANGDQTVTQILTKSLNTGAVWLAQQLGPDRFYDYVQRFGFGVPTGVGLGGEAAGQIRTPDNDPEWRPVDVATNSFGQGISVTPLQLAAALAAIANDGKLMKPYLVQEIISPDGHKTFAPQEVRQVISPQAARTLRDMMGVVVQGIPTYLLDVPGYSVGGKTGTANVVSGEGTYKADAYISSFAGIAPKDDPAIAILVKIDEPRGVPWGTVVAAPAFAKLAREILARYKVPPEAPALVQEAP